MNPIEWLRKRCLEQRRREVATALAEARLSLGFELSTSTDADPFLQGLRTSVANALTRLEAEIPEAEATTQLDSIGRQIEECSNKRAYWLQGFQIQTQTDAAIREMRTWGVPQRYFDEHLYPLQQAVKMSLSDATTGPTPEARLAATRRAQATLEEIFEEYAYWDFYTERYVNRSLAPTAIGLGLVGLASLVLSVIFAFVRHNHLLAVLLAGLGGTCVSILLKQQPLAVYGDNIKSLLWGAGRLLTGIIATIIGMGLLASGSINVGFTPSSDQGTMGLVPIYTMVCACLDPATSDTSPSQPSTKPATVVPGPFDAGVTAPDSGTSGASVKEAPAPARSERKTSTSGAPRQPCGNGALMLLLGLSILFGFSERFFAKILAQFEERAGSDRGTPPPPPSSSPSAPPTMAPPDPPAPPAAGKPENAGKPATPAAAEKPAAPATAPTTAVGPAATTTPSAGTAPLAGAPAPAASPLYASLTRKDPKSQT